MSDILDNDNLQKILEAAEKVPHGPWEYHPRAWEYRDDYLDESEYGVFTQDKNCLVDDGSAWGEYSSVASKEMLQYIAMLDRDTVTAIVKRIQELEKRCVIALPSKDLA